MLLEQNRKNGLRTSGLQFLFWFLLIICGIPQLRTQTRSHHFRENSDGIEIENHQYWITSYLIFYVFSLAIFLFNCCADHEPNETKYPKPDKPYPLLGASFLSRIVYAWFDPLTWKGYRKPLEHNDLWDLNREDTSRELIPLYLKYWNRPTAKSPGYNR